MKKLIFVSCDRCCMPIGEIPLENNHLVCRMICLKCFAKIEEQEIIWKKACTYEKNKYLSYMKIFPNKISNSEKEHFDNLTELAGEK